MKKNTVLIACSLTNDKRAVRSEAFRTPFIFFMNFIIHTSGKEKLCCSFCLLRSTEGHVAFISNNLLALRAEDILDEVAGESGRACHW